VYELSLDPVAEEQIKAVPQEALRPLAELFTLLETAPWSGEPFNPPIRGATCSRMPSANSVSRHTLY
jgi:hypothetical protein